MLRLFQRGKVGFNWMRVLDPTTHFDFYVLRPPSQSVILDRRYISLPPEIWAEVE